MGPGFKSRLTVHRKVGATVIISLAIFLTLIERDEGSFKYQLTLFFANF